MGQTVQFRLGAPQRPAIKHDNGFLDKYPPRKPTAEELEKYRSWRAKLFGAEAANRGPIGLDTRVLYIAIGPLAHLFVPKLERIRSMPDALEAYRHFMDASGTDRQFDYGQFVADDPSGQVILHNCRLVARQGAEQLYRDHYEARIKSGGHLSFNMTGSAIHVRENDPQFPYPETENWQKAIGAHSIWISATVAVTTSKGSPPYFQMAIMIHAEDKYNFNPGQKDIATGIPDEENGVFEITGLAKQYMQYATLERAEWWVGRTVSLQQVVYNSPGTW